MASVYILFSNDLNKFYVGSCFDLSERLLEHKNERYKNAFTASTSDWELFYSIENLTQESARLIEAHIKKMKSKVFILNLKKHPDIIAKLRINYG